MATKGRGERKGEWGKGRERDGREEREREGRREKKGRGEKEKRGTLHIGGGGGGRERWK